MVGGVAALSTPKSPMSESTRPAWSAFSSVIRQAAMRAVMPGASLIVSAKPAEPASSLSTKVAIRRNSSPR